MTPYQLLGIVAVIAVIRVILSLQPVAANSNGRSRALAKEYLDPFIYAGLAAWVLITFVARTYYIPSGSMEPTLQVHDVLLVDKFEYRFHKPNEGDIVVFPPPVPTSDDFIKRVIGRPGDKLRVKGGIVYLNDQPLHEPYIKEAPAYDLEVRDYGIYVYDGIAWQRLSSDQANIPPKSAWSAPDRLPENCYFMMGDNRNNSEDSHIWGCAQFEGTFASGARKGDKAGFTGRAFMRFWPIQQAHIF